MPELCCPPCLEAPARLCRFPHPSQAAATRRGGSVGYIEVRYRGRAKNTAQMLTLFALSNLWMVRRQLLPARGNAVSRQPNCRTAVKIASYL